MKKTGEIREKNKDTKEKTNEAKSWRFEKANKLLKTMLQKKKKKDKLVVLLIKIEQN